MLVRFVCTRRGLSQLTYRCGGSARLAI